MPVTILSRQVFQPATGEVINADGATNLAPYRLTGIGSSSYFGGGTTGNTAPKYSSSILGRLRASLAGTYGDAGSGLILANPAFRTNPTWDDRLGFGGSVSDVAAGWFDAACWEMADGAANYVTMTAVASAFTLHRIGTGAGVVKASIDGGSATVLSNTPNAGSGAAKLLTDTISAGSLASHTIKVWGEGGTVRLFGIESLTGTGRIIVDAGAISGKSMGQFVALTDETNGTYGLPMVDDRRGWVVLINLGANDWQSDTLLSLTTARLQTLCARVRAYGGIPVLHVQPIPSSSLQPGATTWEQHRAAMVAAAAAVSVRVIDHTYLWGATYEAGQAAGMYADTIHPSDAGAISLAAALRSTLGL